MDRYSRILVTGGNGFLGRVVVRKLKERYQKVFYPTKAEYNLCDPQQVYEAYDDFLPDVVIHLAAQVGGIGANQEHPGQFFYNNLLMGLNLIEQARRSGIEKFVQVGTVCSYPKNTPVPFREDDLWNGYPEETNAPYGIAKKSLITMLDAYKKEYGLKSAVVLPVNLYGPGDNFDPLTSHVIPALIRKCIVARDLERNEVQCWGTGNASREFLYVDDAAEGIIKAAEKIETPDPINLGTGEEISIRCLAITIKLLTNFIGQINWDCNAPDGQPRRCLDISRAKNLLGWSPTIDLETGLRRTIEWYESI